jgi:hypothetical protein
VRKIHLVLDNLNTHWRESFVEVLGVKTAATLLRRIEFHYTPTHASWLNMAEIEIGVLQRQMPGALLYRAEGACHRGRGLATATQCRSMWYRMDLHPSRCRSKARRPLCLVINVSHY